jgi:formylglycine-generating enzyme required for sulfatase activity
MLVTEGGMVVAEGGPVTAIAAAGDRLFVVATFDGRLRLLEVPPREPPYFSQNAGDLGSMPGQIRILKVEERDGMLLAIGDNGTLLHGRIRDGRIDPVPEGRYRRERFTLEQAAPATAGPLPPERERALKPGDIFRECNNCPELVVVPAGGFTMGSPVSEKDRSDDEGPQHDVSIGKNFAVSRTEVTFDEWRACVEDKGCPGNRSPDDRGWGKGSRPVINVSWDDAKEYVAWLSGKTGKPYRLLTEAEWEYAARAGTATTYSWGDEIGKGNANCDGCGSQWDNKQTAPVGSFKPNVFGLYDMHGNAWEWVEDCWRNSYQGAPLDGSAWAIACPDERRVVRGGSWGYDPRSLRAAFRFRYTPVNRDNYIGFRLARTLNP